MARLLFVDACVRGERSRTLKLARRFLEAYRREHMSVCLVRYFLRMLETELHADVAFCVCWKPQGKIPVTRSLEAFQFRHLADVARFWYDVPELECPICRGRCRCDAAVYYKLFEGGSKP